MARGRLDPPNLDDRTWQDIVAQAKALIPTYAPEWTDHSPNDPGIALIELFAWIVEGMIYRLNRVPDKNLIAFLNLIGETRNPATPAATLLTFRASPSPGPILVPQGTRAGTRQTAEDDAIVFETDRAKTVLPINLRRALVITPGSGGAPGTYAEVTGQLAAAPLSGLKLSIPPGETAMIALGFDDATTETVSVDVRFTRPVPAVVDGQADPITIDLQYSNPGGAPLTALAPDRWSSDLLETSDGTQGLKRNGPVTALMPTDWESQAPTDWSHLVPSVAPVTDALFWIGALITSSATASDIPFELEYLVFNTALASNALTIDQPEPLGSSDGSAFQQFELRHRPLFKRVGAADPFDHLVVEVREPAEEGRLGGWQPLQRVDRFPPGNAAVFRLDPITGMIHLGDFDPNTGEGNGRIPPVGSEIRAATYRYVAGGRNGNVPPGTVEVLRTPVPGLLSAVNPGQGRGGSDEESVEDALRRGPQGLRTRNRAVTAEDYEFLTFEATTDVVKVRCLEARQFTELDGLPPGQQDLIGQPWTYGGLDRSPGRVNVLIIPDGGLDVPRPVPSPELIIEVADYLTARRTIGAAVHVAGPRYLPIRVTVAVTIFRSALQKGLLPSLEDAARAQVAGEMRALIRRYLHPIHGRADGKGWSFGDAVSVSGLFEFIQPDPQIGFITMISVSDDPPAYEPPDRPPTTSGTSVIELADYEMPCSAEKADPGDDDPHVITVTLN